MESDKGGGNFTNTLAFQLGDKPFAGVIEGGPILLTRRAGSQLCERGLASGRGEGMLSQHQQVYVGPCPVCGCPIWWDEDTEKYVRTCDCRLTKAEVEGDE